MYVYLCLKKGSLISDLPFSSERAPGCFMSQMLAGLVTQRVVSVE